MQSYKFDEIIEKAAFRKNLDKELLKSISNFVFTETKQEMGMFSNLRIYLEGLIVFFYGKKRLVAFKDKLANPGKYKFKVSFLSKKSDEEIKEVEEKVDHLLEVYEVYIKDKRETKQAFKECKNNEYIAKVQKLEEESK